MDIIEVFQKVSNEYCSSEQLATEQRIQTILGMILEVHRCNRSIGYVKVEQVTPYIVDYFRNGGFTVQEAYLNKQDCIKISWIPSKPQ